MTDLVTMMTTTTADHMESGDRLVMVGDRLVIGDRLDIGGHLGTGGHLVTGGRLGTEDHLEGGNHSNKQTVCVKSLPQTVTARLYWHQTGG